MIVLYIYEMNISLLCSSKIDLHKYTWWFQELIKLFVCFVYISRLNKE